jgi:prophage antirepressor-like protein
MKNEKISQIGFSDEFTYCNIPIKYEVTEDKKLQLYVEDCAKSLGITQTKNTQNGDSITIRWERVYSDLVGIDRIPNSGDFKKLDNDTKKEIRNKLKQMTISESELYLWSFRVDGEQGKKFREWLATVVLPCLREYGIYITNMENMSASEIEIAVKERTEAYILRKHGINIRKSLTDTIKKYINPAPYESDRYYGGFTNIVYNVLFGLDCKPYKILIGAEEKDNLRDYLKDKDMSTELNHISKAEDFMCNLIMSGVKDEKQLKTFLTNWYSNVI